MPKCLEKNIHFVKKQELNLIFLDLKKDVSKVNFKKLALIVNKN